MLFFFFLRYLPTHCIKATKHRDRKAFIDATRDKCELCVRLKAGISHVGFYGTAATK